MTIGLVISVITNEVLVNNYLSGGGDDQDHIFVDCGDYQLLVSCVEMMMMVIHQIRDMVLPLIQPQTTLQH